MRVSTHPRMHIWHITLQEHRAFSGWYDSVCHSIIRLREEALHYYQNDVHFLPTPEPLSEKRGRSFQLHHQRLGLNYSVSQQLLTQSHSDQTSPWRLQTSGENSLLWWNAAGIVGVPQSHSQNMVIQHTLNLGEQKAGPCFVYRHAVIDGLDNGRQYWEFLWQVSILF